MWGSEVTKPSRFAQMAILLRLPHMKAAVWRLWQMRRVGRLSNPREGRLEFVRGFSGEDPEAGAVAGPVRSDDHGYVVTTAAVYGTTPGQNFRWQPRFLEIPPVRLRPPATHAALRLGESPRVVNRLVASAQTPRSAGGPASLVAGRWHRRHEGVTASARRQLVLAR